MSKFNDPGDTSKEVQAVFTRSEILELMAETTEYPFPGPSEEEIVKLIDGAFARKLPGGTHTPGQRVAEMRSPSPSELPKATDAGFER